MLYGGRFTGVFELCSGETPDGSRRSQSFERMQTKRPGLCHVSVGESGVRSLQLRQNCAMDVAPRCRKNGAIVRLRSAR